MYSVRVENGIVTQVLAGKTDGLIQTEEHVSPGWAYDGQAFTPPPPPSPTSSDVNAERDRRVTAGASFTPAGYGQAIPVAGDEQTKVNLLALATAAQARMAQGDMATLTPYRDESNAVHQLTPPQVFDLWSQGAAYVSAVYQASWALKDGAIPADYTDDGYWP